MIGDRKSLGQKKWCELHDHINTKRTLGYGCVNKNNLCFVTTITTTAPIPFSLIYLLGMDVHACVCSHNNNRTFFLRIINIYHLSERSITVFSRTIESCISIERSTNNNKIIMLHCNLPVAIHDDYYENNIKNSTYMSVCTYILFGDFFSESWYFGFTVKNASVLALKWILYAHFVANQRI